MLSSLRVIARKNECSRFLFTRKLPFGSSKPFQCVTIKAFTRSFSQTVPFRHQKNLTDHRFIATAAYSQPQSLPNDVESFLDELENYAIGSAKISKSKLKKLIKKYHNNPEMGHMLIRKSLEFMKNSPESRGLFNGECFYNVIRNCVNRDQVEKADELLTLCQLTARVQPHPRCFNIVMSGYAKRRTPEALKRIEEMLKSLEQDRLSDSAPYTTPLDRVMYYVLMNAYIKVLGIQSLDHVRRTIERMSKIAERLEDHNLRPNLSCHTMLIKAFMLRRDPGFASEVNALFDQLKADPHYSAQPAVDKMYLENMAIDAWTKSGAPNASNRARQIFDTMEEPTHVAYNSLCSIYARNGDVDKVCDLYEKMQTDFESGKNKKCRPDEHTFAIVMNALQKSNRSDAVEKAEQIFNAIHLPDTITYSTLLNMYAQKGFVEKALDLVHQMQSDFQSGKNKNCRPNLHTNNIILNALQKSNRPDDVKKAEHIFNDISSPDTISYTMLLKMYARNGATEKALSLLDQMQSDFQSGKNKTCRPDIQTYNIVLKALQKSSRSDAANISQLIFNAIPSPDTITYNTLLNIYAERKMGKDAVSLVRRMQSDFDTKKNCICRPDTVTQWTLMKALRIANDSVLNDEARDELEWFRN
jgi:pentatricopeptide repeat protein